jgi:hypothetical protein
MTENTCASYTGIHSSVPEEHTEKPGVSLKYDERRERVLLYLMAHKDYVTAWKINDSLKIDNTSKSFCLIRKLIKEMNHYANINNSSWGIISDNKGFKYCTSRKEAYEDIERLLVRRKGLDKLIADRHAIAARLQ